MAHRDPARPAGPAVLVQRTLTVAAADFTNFTNRLNEALGTGLGAGGAVVESR